jgi:hypothetical protein
MVLLAAVFCFWLYRIGRPKRRISDKPIFSTTRVGTHDHHGNYLEVEVQTGLVNIVEEP